MESDGNFFEPWQKSFLVLDDDWGVGPSAAAVYDDEVRIPIPSGTWSGDEETWSGDEETWSGDEETWSGDEETWSGDEETSLFEYQDAGM
ncbi:hypothetical protein E4U23_000128 [Claviceps purpurea]|nr:hypothetical protein E4U23_000128 [Claviceps purpurea]